MKNLFYGREEQFADLERLWGKRTSSFVTCRGRRRICNTITSYRTRPNSSFPASFAMIVSSPAIRIQPNRRRPRLFVVFS